MVPVVLSDTQPPDVTKQFSVTHVAPQLPPFESESLTAEL